MFSQFYVLPYFFQAYPEYIIYYRIKSPSQYPMNVSNNASCTNDSELNMLADDTSIDNTSTGSKHKQTIVESDTQSDLLAETSCASVDGPLLMNSSTSSLESSIIS